MFPQHLHPLLHGDAREGYCRRDNLYPKPGLNFSAVFFGHPLIDIHQPLLDRAHDLFVQIDPGHFHIDRGELGHMPGGKGRVCPESGANFKHTLEPGCHSHLLVELWRLGQVGFGSKVRHLEKLSTGFGGRTHQFWGMDPDKTVLDPVFTHGLFSNRHHLKQEPVVWPAQIQKTPVKTVIQGRQCGCKWVKWKRRIRTGGASSVCRRISRPAQLYNRVARYHAGDGQRRFEVKGRNLLCQPCVAVFLIHYLNHPARIAQYQELHLLLIAQRLQPALDFDRLANRSAPTTPINVRSMVSSTNDE